MISAELKGDAEVASRFDRFGVQLQDELRSSLTRLAEGLRQAIVQGKLSGQVLHARSGMLQRSVVAGTAIDANGAISVSVSSNAPYAALHEYGFKGSETMRAHVRRISQAFGRQITARTIQVGSYSRSVDYPERSFMRSALRDLEASGAIRAEIDAAIGRATA